MLLGTLIAAYAMVSLHATARAPQVLEESRIGAQLADAAPADADDEEHCNQQTTETTALLCKYHCQSAVQTLDHPDVRVSAVADAAFLIVAAFAAPEGQVGVSLPATRPDAAHHGGALPLYQRTARLRI